MLRSIVVGVIFIVAVVNAGPHFLHHILNKHVTYDINGFKGPHKEAHGMYHGWPLAPAPAPHFGPYYQPYHHHHHHHTIPEHLDHGPQCHWDQNNHHNHGNGYPEMTAFNPFNGPNLPFNPMHPFDVQNSKPNQFGDSTLLQSSSPNNPLNKPLNRPFDPLSTSPSTFNVNTPLSPLDPSPNVVIVNPSNVQNPTAPSTVNGFNQFNVNIRPQTGMAREISSQV